MDLKLHEDIIKEEFLDYTEETDTECASVESVELPRKAIIGDPGNPEDSICSLKHSAIREKILNGEFKIIEKKGRSKVWDVFGRVSDDTRNEIPRIVVCKKCLNIYKYNERQTSNLVKHNCYVLASSVTEKTEVDDGCKKLTANIFTEWIIEDCRPLEIVTDTGFRKVIKFLIEIGVKYGANVEIETLLPIPSTISNKVESLYITYFDEIRNEIISVKDTGFGLTINVLNDNYLRKSFLAITIHYIKLSQLMVRFLGLLSMEEDKYTPTKIYKEVNNLLSDYGCSLNDKIIIVSEKSSNMTNAFQNFNNIFCISHLIHNTVEQSLNENPEISELCQLCTNIVNDFQKLSPTNNLNSTLKSCSSSKMHTIYYNLLSVQKNWTKVLRYLQETEDSKNTDILNQNNLKELISVLQPFEEISKLLEVEENPTMHIAYAHINLLKKKCIIQTNDSDIIKKLKEILSCHIQSEIIDNLTIFHKVGLFLYPPANKLIQFDETERNKVIDECKRQMMIYGKDSKESIYKNQPQCNNSSINSEALRDFVSQPYVRKSNDAVTHEIELYQTFNVTFSDEFDLLQWWDLHKNELPLMYKVSCKIFGTPASSSTSKRIFSDARKLISDQSNQICSNDLTINQIMFLNCNINKNRISKDLLNVVI